MVALAEHYGDGPVSVATIAKSSAIPSAYLEQLISPLRKSGLVTSRRGAHGGYLLARVPSDIRIGEIYRAMEGPIAPMECVSENEDDQTCPLIPNCQTRPVWVNVRDAIATALDGMTLSDLIQSGMAPIPAPLAGVEALDAAGD